MLGLSKHLRSKMTNTMNQITNTHMLQRDTSGADPHNFSMSLPLPLPLALELVVVVVVVVVVLSSEAWSKTRDLFLILMPFLLLCCDSLLLLLFCLGAMGVGCEALPKTAWALGTASV